MKMMWIAKIYAYLYIAIKKLFGINIPGLGFLLRRCKSPGFIPFLGQGMYFEPGAASSYGLHVIGSLHEPETHQFLNRVFDYVSNQPSWFIEVGANIGAFLIDVARRDDVQVIGFEPSVYCVDAIRKSMARNGRSNYQVFPNLVGDSDEDISFNIGRHDGSASVLTADDKSIKVPQVRLDEHHSLTTIPSGSLVVLMIDVEGYEPKVLMGGGTVY
jgi:FkbM family methyltransferase